MTSAEQRGHHDDEVLTFAEDRSQAQDPDLDDDIADALERRRADRGTRLHGEVNDLLRAGLRAADESLADEDGYTLPTFDPGRQLLTGTRTPAQLMDDEDIERGLP